MRSLGLAALLFFLAASAWAQVAIIGRTRIQVEVARTPAEWQKGLMHRKRLPPDRGMLFIFQEEAVRFFWMKDTPIPLDVAFLDSSGKILAIKTMKPFSLEAVSSEKACRYALEVNAGFFKKIKARPGERIRLKL